jgi:hypothetical protein
MPAYFWVNTGNGSNVGWATTTGGTATVFSIGENDDVTFDINSGLSYGDNALTARNCTIAANATLELYGTFQLNGSFINNSAVVDISGLNLNMYGKTGTWTITTANRPIGYVILSFYDSTQNPTYNLGSAITTNSFFDINDVNFNTQNYAVTGNFFINSIPMVAARTINLGSSVVSSTPNNQDEFTALIGGGNFRSTLNLNTSKINSNICDIDVGLSATMTASAGQAFNSDYFDCYVNANLAVTTGTISATAEVSLYVSENTTTTTFGAISANSIVEITHIGSATLTVGTINGNVNTPADLSIRSEFIGGGTLNIGAIGGVTANSIGTIRLTSYNTVNLTGIVQCVGNLNMTLFGNTTITGAVTTGTISTNSSGAIITRFNSTATTTNGSIRVNGSSDSSTRFAGAIVSADDFLINSPVTISGTVTIAGDLETAYTAGTVTFPAAVTASNIAISSDSTTFSTGTHNIADSFYWYGGNLALGSSTLIVKKYLNLTDFGTFTRGTSTVRVGEYIGDPAYPGRTSGMLYSGPNVFNILQLRGDVITALSEITTTTLSRTGNANNYGETIFTGNVTVTGTGAGALTITGNSVTNRMLVSTGITGTPITITATARTLTNVDFKDITAAGGTWTGTSLGDCLGNSGITFTPAVVRYVRSAGTWANTAIWSANSGGVGGATVPLAQDAVIINNLSGNTAITVGNVRTLGANVTVTADYLGTINFNGNTTSGGAIIKSSVYGTLNIQRSNVVITSDSNTAVEFCNRSTPVVLNYGNNANTVVNTRIDVGNNTVTLASTLGSLSNRNNKLILSSGTFSTGDYDMYLGEITGSIYSLGSPQLSLNNSNVYVYNNFIRCITTPGNSNVYAFNLSEINTLQTVGGFYNLYISNTDTIKDITLNATINNLVSSNHPQYPSTANFRLNDGTIRVKKSFDIGSQSAKATLNNVEIWNDTYENFQTSYASYYNCELNGATNGITAFGLADLGNNVGSFEFPSVIKAYAFSNSSAQSFTIPDDFTGSAILIAYGAGGAGSTSDTALSGRGGGSGATASSDIVELSRGQTVYISSTTYTLRGLSEFNGGDGNVAWINTQSNSAPISTAQGVSASGGYGARGTTVGAGGNITLGRYTTNGKAGGSAGFSIGGGGASVTNAGATVLEFGGSGVTSGLSNPGSAQRGTSANLTANSTPGLNGTEGIGQGGGIGGDGFFTTITKTGTYLRASTDTTLTIFSTGHGLISDSSYPITINSSPSQTGTYSRTGGNANVIITRTDHGLTSNANIYLDFTSGTAVDGYYTVNVISTSQFRVVTSSTSGTTGSVRLLPFPTTGANLAVTVISPDQFTVTTLSTAPVTGNVTVTYGSPVRNASAGGNGSNSSLVEITYLNGEYQGFPTPAIGPGGGGGGGGARASNNSSSVGGAGGQGGIGAGGGGAGRTSTTAVPSGAGGPGLVLIVYAYGKPSSFGLIQY